ncbi:MAG TPA: hypothetical protein VE775_09770, partial [Pyrinomonadaceae bacterium]|nr:hypothetical protein [Pyrinomonadaceae bacterium]
GQAESAALAGQRGGLCVARRHSMQLDRPPGRAILVGVNVWLGTKHLGLLARVVQYIKCRLIGPELGAG